MEIADSVLSILLQNSRNEKHIQTSVTGRSLHYLTEFVTRRLQEVMLFWLSFQRIPRELLPKAKKIYR
jgi:hypothetical protein